MREAPKGGGTLRYKKRALLIPILQAGRRCPSLNPTGCRHTPCVLYHSFICPFRLSALWEHWPSISVTRPAAVVAHGHGHVLGWGRSDGWTRERSLEKQHTHTHIHKLDYRRKRCFLQLVRCPCSCEYLLINDPVSCPSGIHSVSKKKKDT